MSSKRERETGRQGEKKKQQSWMVSMSGIPRRQPQEEEGETQGPRLPSQLQGQPEGAAEPGRNQVTTVTNS